MGKKLWIVLVFCIVLLPSLTQKINASVLVNAPELFNDALMKDLLQKGYAWDSLIHASTLGYELQLPVQTVLELKLKGQNWEEMDKVFAEMKAAKSKLREKDELEERPVLKFLVQNGFDDEEILMLTYSAKISNTDLQILAEKAVREKAVKEKGGKDKDQGLAITPSTASTSTLTISTTSITAISPTTTASTTLSSSTATNTTSYKDPGYGYNADKCSPFATILQHRNETINPAAGSLTLVETDLVLPGKNGLDFALTRVYQSDKAELAKMGADIGAYEAKEVSTPYYTFVCCPGYGDQYQVFIEKGTPVDPNTGMIDVAVPPHTVNGVLHPGFATTIPAAEEWVANVGIRYHVNNYTYGTNYGDSRYHLGVGWEWDLPSLEKSDQGWYVHLGQGATYQVDWENYPTGLKGVQQKEYVFAAYLGSRVPNAEYVLSNKSGTNYYFDSNGLLIHIQNQFGDYIELIWSKSGENFYLSKVVDTVKRVINFDYTDPAVVKVTYSLGTSSETISYRKSYNAENVSQLSAVQLPEGITLAMGIS